MPPTAEQCSSWNSEVFRHWHEHGDLHDRLEKKWPKKFDRFAFYNWLQNRTDNHHIGAFISRKAIIDRISTTAYNEFADRRKLSIVLTQSVIPCLPAGKDRAGNVYRITPDGYGLRPDRRYNHYKSLYDSVLSITFSQDSNNSSQFLFHQIGKLEVWCGNTRKFEDSDSESDDPEIYEGDEAGSWVNTYYYIVMRIDETGTSKGLYLIFDFHPEFDDDDGKRNVKVGINDSLDGWGPVMIEVDGRRVTVAKIADSIKQLRFTREFDLTEVSHDSADIVTTIQTKQGILKPTTDDVDIDDIDDTHLYDPEWF
ncbi:MAG: hypothetical protein M1813_009240 [Trichoglossum hirsutum]|nr:MAG: hypothetical protein M1813_009240 [Trichoglossum hirsutum]